ncbi:MULTISPECIES: peptidase domain-containing ABC transporter [Rhodanobacter]|uniref:peptidase domain-containing ABC transporter n=1 Tax=Rhodanobacter TaxID=75309 RepID=UPI0004204005|nr:MULTISPECIES: peptidase domain-containing ABC transporter [Rhodanobacter]KZC18488.1 ABC transporter [Rhodanobacter denitrificans]UJJ50341.1 peptidase domain-containing ABC transporter [Rhodanobacter denitrificans]UJM93057.1 peptidase domain-containing ABC transporter [Rhodanobacter denitrificans]UJM96588.1 peptidase domain-containing ABC transporter [Rhodanobacter denitrificans]UJN20582.1 peptidase domain-containing ABC transporter [Rhodanobacter denitrificans]
MADGAPHGSAASPVRGYRAALQFGWHRPLPMMLQTEATECGLACLAMVASYHGHDVDLAGLRRRFSTSLKGATLAQVMAMAAQLGFVCRPLKLDLEQLSQLKMPCLLHWDLNHFVVLKLAGKHGVVIHDPARGLRKLSLKEVSGHFTGVALELSVSADFAPVRERQAVSLRALTGTVRGLVPALSQILLLALALEVFALAAPFYLQWVLDQVLVSADRDLLTLLGLGFIGITIFSAVITAARSWAVTWLGATLNVQWASNLFGHLMHLPLDWFEKRHVGDVVSRFGSIQTIQRTLTTQFIGSLLDGLMSLVTLVVMGFYSLWLTVLVVGLFLAYGLIRWAFFNPLRRANEEQIVYGARQQSELLESIRGAMPIKLANKQDERLSRYANATVSTANREIGIQRLGIAFALSNQLMFGLGRVAMIWIAATLALDGKFSAGMLIAFIAYADQFTSRAAGLIDKWVDFRMLKLHAERVADIALTAPEKSAEAAWAGPIPEASIELHSVSFRYAEGEPWILKDCNLRIEVGESVAIVGPSGCGKSTLAKIVLGLLQPTAGEVHFGGIDIRKLGLETYRQWIGAVMQDDQLFAGSVADNISFFDPEATPVRVEAAARLAAIHEDIVVMPMGYQSLVGDMGSSLSGGQKQRVILARALYRRPKLLVLDEATSHLDINREQQVIAAVNRLAVTRLVIAHRTETIANAQQVLVVANGTAQPIPSHSREVEVMG